MRRGILKKLLSSLLALWIILLYLFPGHGIAHAYTAGAKNITINASNIKMISLSNKIFQNVTIKNPAKSTDIILKNVTIKGTLTIEKGYLYQINAANSTINTVHLETGSGTASKAGEKNKITQNHLRPKLKIEKSSEIKKLLADSSFILINKGKVKDAVLSPKPKSDNIISLTGFNGTIEIRNSKSSNLIIKTNKSAIKKAMLTGTGNSSKVSWNDVSKTSPSSIASLQLKVPVKSSINLITDTITVADKAKGSSLTLQKPVTAIYNNAQSIHWNLTSNVAKFINTEKNSTISLDKNAVIQSLESTGAGNHISGTGTINNAAIIGNDTIINSRILNFNISEQAAGTLVNGQAIAAGTVFYYYPPENKADCSNNINYENSSYSSSSGE